MSIMSVKFAGLTYSPSARKYAVKLELEVAENKTSIVESAYIWEDSGLAVEAGDRAIFSFVHYGSLPDLTKKW